jgi:RNA polymerase sigma factor (sigma-70 family)
MDTSASAKSVAKHLRDQDSVAAAKLEQFKRRLWLIARKHLNTQLRSSVDPDDVVQSAIGTFFNNLDAAQSPAKVGNTSLNGWDDVENLLVGITLNKCRKKFEQASAKKRDISRTTQLLDDMAVIANEPSEENGLEFIEVIEKFDISCTEQERRLLKFLQQGLTQAEIAAILHLSQALISLKIKRMIARLRAQLRESDNI